METAETSPVKAKRYWGRTLVAFLVVLCAMPLGHALMILMEHFLPESALHGCAFAMGAVGLGIVIAGVFVKGDTRQTILGLVGGLLFWTGWVEFLLQYYAARYGVQPEIVNGEVVTKPEYLIMPATFGFWMLIMTVYIFSVKTGCYFITWIQKRIFGKRKDEIHFHHHIHGTQHDDVGLLSAADVLLRPEVSRRPSPCNPAHRRRLSDRSRLHVHQAA